MKSNWAYLGYMAETEAKADLPEAYERCARKLARRCRLTGAIDERDMFEFLHEEGIYNITQSEATNIETRVKELLR